MSDLDPLEPVRSADCVSDHGFDQLHAGELGQERAAEIHAHVQGCARCSERSATLQRARAQFQHELAPRLIARAAQPARPSIARRVPWIAAAAGALAIAAGVLLVLRPSPIAPPPASGERTKGAGGLGFFVQHRGHVRRGASGERVAPGDALRFTYSTRERAYFAVLSRDGNGRSSVYFPAAPDARAQAVEPGRDVPLPIGTELDAVIGDETLYGLFCDEPLVLEPLRAALERSGDVPSASGCRIDRVQIEKRAEGGEL